ncbi:hypothetical protein BDA96_07G137100 [Sorghum bicolor]|uniref:FLZ-type domain-containing protein n=2 Tax=Sorghum bicolor TaxID=4558 RepID=A0A1Z5RAG3_SORBI|nr:uncharacterized protein LOC110436806 [Sorghum bicolor]KAG0523605.1 hypothetical protein BDA96_07G137100 [Sorghum bicolor]OQU80431.1 hypothetical protein SORBI_3007G127900 [Sorghum bicolor]|eukprot:XP_021319989.1 uncharacterized protein LOC110436806 [Sorghum bicolor]
MSESMSFHAGGLFATRVPYNPETCVGLKAALVEPASAHLHVAEPVRRSARSITMATMRTDRCSNGCTCNTPFCMMTTTPSCVDDYSLLFCKLCDRRMDDCTIYMYMSMGFCTEECRNEYFLEYRYRVAMAMEAESRRTRSEARKKAPVAEGEAAIGYRSIFFTCTEVESFL